MVALRSGDLRGLGLELETLRHAVDVMGHRSARAQGRGAPITSLDKLRASDHRLYVRVKAGERGKTVVMGILKVGAKNLFIRRESGEFSEIQPTCVLDFYVHESCQRQGVGRALFEHFLEGEGRDPEKLAYDRPSPKLIGFLRKHYGLVDYLPQANNFVVFKRYFDGVASTRQRGWQSISARPLTAKRRHVKRSASPMSMLERERDPPQHQAANLLRHTSPQRVQAAAPHGGLLEPSPPAGPRPKPAAAAFSGRRPSPPRRGASPQQAPPQAAAAYPQPPPQAYRGHHRNHGRGGHNPRAHQYAAAGGPMYGRRAHPPHYGTSIAGFGQNHAPPEAALPFPTERHSAKEHADYFMAVNKKRVARHGRRALREDRNTANVVRAMKQPSRRGGAHYAHTSGHQAASCLVW